MESHKREQPYSSLFKREMVTATRDLTADCCAEAQVDQAVPLAS
jgi:hypothetical protein